MTVYPTPYYYVEYEFPTGWADALWEHVFPTRASAKKHMDDLELDFMERRRYRIIKVDSVALKDLNMDEMVYFAASFHNIPLRVADEIRELLMSYTKDTVFNFDYSKPILPPEDN